MFIVFLFVIFVFFVTHYFYFSLFLMLTRSSYQSYHVANCKLSLYEITHMYPLSIHCVTVDPLARHFLIFLDFSAVPVVQYLMRRYCTTYSLSSRSSVTRSMHMGARTQPLLCFPTPSSIELQSSPPLRRHVS